MKPWKVSREDMNLCDWLDTIQIKTDLSTVDVDVTGWFGVSDDRGVYAYFGNEKDACRFRLNEISRRMNDV